MDQSRDPNPGTPRLAELAPPAGAASERPDRDLLEAWRGADGAAFAALVQRHQGALLHHARALLRNAGAAEDAVQEAFLRLARKPPTRLEEGGESDQRAQLASWLHRVTRNLCMDVLRSEARRKQREAEVALTEATPGGLDAVERADTRAAVERGLERLPESQREVLVLRLLGDKSYREIADITGQKMGTVGWLVSEGLKALSSELAPLLGNDVARSSARGI